MTNPINPILHVSERKPAKNPGTVVVFSDGRTFRQLDAVLEPVRLLPPPDATGAPPPQPKHNQVPGEPVFNIDNPIVQRSLTVAATGAQGAASAARHMLEAAKRSSWAARLMGQAHQYYLVDIGRKHAAQSLKPPSASSMLNFSVELTFDVRVVDPVKVVELGIADLGLHHATRLRNIVSEITQKITIDQVDQARRDIQSRLQRGINDHIIEIVEISADVSVDEAAAVWLRTVGEEQIKIAAAEAAGRVGSVQRSGEKAAIGSFDELLAEWARTGDPKYKAIFDTQMAASAAMRDEKIKVLLVALEKGLIEEFEVRERYPALLNQILSGQSSHFGQEKPPRVEDGSSR